MADPLLDEAARIRTRSGRTAEVVGLLADRIADLEQDNEGEERLNRRLAAAGRAVLAAWDVTPSDIWHAQQAKVDFQVALDGLRGLVAGQPTDEPTEADPPHYEDVILWQGETEEITTVDGERPKDHSWFEEAMCLGLPPRSEVAIVPLAFAERAWAVGGRFLRCTYCEGTFDTADDLAAHGISAHGGPLVGGRSAAPTREQVEVGTDWQTRYLIKAGGDERQTWVVETNPDGVFPPPIVCLIRTDDLPEADR